MEITLKPPFINTVFGWCFWHVSPAEDPFSYLPSPFSFFLASINWAPIPLLPLLFISSSILLFLLLSRLGKLSQIKIRDNSHVKEKGEKSVCFLFSKERRVVGEGRKSKRDLRWNWAIPQSPSKLETRFLSPFFTYFLPFCTENAKLHVGARRFLDCPTEKKK